MFICSHSSKDTRESVALSKRVTSKLDAGDFCGAIHLASYEDPLTPFDNATLEAFKVIHPASHPNSFIPPPPHLEDMMSCVQVTAN